jgi:hypothetical protein
LPWQSARVHSTPQRPDKLPLVSGPVEGIRPSDPVGHHQMGMQQRVTFSGRPVVDADRQQPLSGHVLDTAVAAAGPKELVQVGDRLGQPGVVGGQHPSPGGRVTQAVQDRHALGRPQDYIKARHGVATVWAAEQLPGRGVAALEHGLEPRRRCFAQPEAAGGGAVPPARGLTVAREILLVVLGELAGVVRLPPYRELGDVGHHPAAPSPPSLAPAPHPWCIALLGKWFGVRVGREQACERR